MRARAALTVALRPSRAPTSVGRIQLSQDGAGLYSGADLCRARNHITATGNQDRFVARADFTV